MPPPTSSLGAGPSNAEEELEDLQRRYHLLEGDRKAYYETSQWTIKQNKDNVNQLKKENKELQKALAKVHKEKGNTIQHSIQIELQKTQNEVHQHRRRCDDLKAKRLSRQQRVTKLSDELKDVEKMATPPVEDESPVARKIRSLENRLDKAMIKYNEAQSIRKTYEQILKRLSEERIGFDNQLGAIEKQVSAREADLQELRLMSHDAHHAKEVAKADLQRYQVQLEEERAQRQKELTEMRALVQAKSEMNQRMEKREKQRSAHDDEDEEGKGAGGRRGSGGFVGRAQEEKKLEENQEKVTTYEEAFRKIKDATGVTDVNEVIQKFLTQEDTHKSLLAMVKEAQARIDTLTEEKASAKARVEEIKYSATGSTGSHRIVDEFETQLSDANAKCERNKQKYERIARVLINAKAGIEHLADKLESVKSDLPTVPLTDDTVVEVLSICEHKLTKLLDAINMEEQADGEAETPAATDGQPRGLYSMQPAHEVSQYNVRIQLPQDEVPSRLDDDDFGEDDGDEVLDRAEIKRRSQAAQEKNQKKPRRGRKKKVASADKSGSGGGAPSSAAPSGGDGGSAPTGATSAPTHPSMG